MPRYRDEDKGIFEGADTGMFRDDPEETAAKLTAGGAIIPVECKHCGDEVVLQVEWPEVVAMSRHAPARQWARTPTGYVCNVVCPRCHQNYMNEGWGQQLSDVEAAAIVTVSLSQAKGWLKRGRKFAVRAMQGQSGAAPGAPVGWRMYQKGMVGGIPCTACGSAAVAKLYWPEAVKLLQRRPTGGWEPFGDGYARPLHCPACKAPVRASVSVERLTKWVRKAMQRGLVR